MQRINVTVSDDAKEKLLAFQRKRAIKRQDDAMTAILEELDI
jgi:hypothetical protein